MINIKSRCSRHIIYVAQSWVCRLKWPWACVCVAGTVITFSDSTRHSLRSKHTAVVYKTKQDMVCYFHFMLFPLSLQVQSLSLSVCVSTMIKTVYCTFVGKRMFTAQLSTAVFCVCRAPPQGTMNIRRTDGWPTFNTKKDQSKLMLWQDFRDFPVSKQVLNI